MTLVPVTFLKNGGFVVAPKYTSYESALLAAPQVNATELLAVRVSPVAGDVSVKAAGALHGE
jgi:hypothetical protein